MSHETIYRSLYIQARRALKKELLEHLRKARTMRRSRHHTKKCSAGQMKTPTDCLDRSTMVSSFLHSIKSRPFNSAASPLVPIPHCLRAANIAVRAPTCGFGRARLRVLHHALSCDRQRSLLVANA